MNASLAVPVFIFALVPTGLASFLFIWLLRDIVKPRLARALVANSLSLLTLTVAVGFGLASNGEPNFGEALMCFFMPQGIWTSWFCCVAGRWSPFDIEISLGEGVKHQETAHLLARELRLVEVANRAILQSPTCLSQRHAMAVLRLEPTGLHAMGDNLLELLGRANPASGCDGHDRTPLHRLAPGIVSQGLAETGSKSIKV